MGVGGGGGVCLARAIQLADFLAVGEGGSVLVEARVILGASLKDERLGRGEKIPKRGGKRGEEYFHFKKRVRSCHKGVKIPVRRETGK